MRRQTVRSLRKVTGKRKVSLVSGTRIEFPLRSPALGPNLFAALAIIFLADVAQQFHSANYERTNNSQLRFRSGRLTGNPEGIRLLRAFPLRFDDLLGSNHRL